MSTPRNENPVIALTQHLQVTWVYREHHWYGGPLIEEEVRDALQGKVDLSKEFVLILTAGCRKTGENSYNIRTPYFGIDHSPASGQAFAADCEMLTTNFTDQSHYVRFDEPMGKFEFTQGEFNRWYVGGIAHELAHALGIAHNNELQSENKISLMYQHGSRSYRQEEVGQPDSFITQLTAVKLATNPLFTQSNHNRETRFKTTLEDLKVSFEEGKLHLKGQIQDGTSPIGLAAYLNPDDLRSDHDAIGWITPVNDNQFQLEITHPSIGQYQLSVEAIYANGYSHTLFEWDYRSTPTIDPEARETLQILAATTLFNHDQHEKANEALAQIDKPRSQRTQHRKQFTESLIDTTPTIDLSSTQEEQVALSDVQWKNAEVGWHFPARNHFPMMSRAKSKATPIPIVLKKQPYLKGIYAHAPSRYVYDLGGKWNRFEATIGLQNGAHAQGSGVFILKGDGKELFRSEKLDAESTAEVDVDVSNIETLELIVNTGKHGNANCWTVWAEPTLRR